ncbi:hypothetical protein NFI96_000065 [Prochilodus magdalenae]|nr:hypothetical protein NFI96_000065 [Prochilodus magdalenae]
MAVLSPISDPHQFAYKATRSTEDAIATALHTAPTHLEHQGSYVRMLFMDFSSAFNTVIPHRLVTKLTELGLSQPTLPLDQRLPQPTCFWIKDFYNPPTSGSKTSTTHLPLDQRLPQPTCLWIKDFLTDRTKFADDTTVVGLISGGGETIYRDEVQGLTEWCSLNTLTLNSSKTKELIIDFRQGGAVYMYINGDGVERVLSFSFLATHISEDLSWTTNTMALVKKAQQRLCFLRIQEKQPSGEAAGVLLLLRHRECADILYLNVVQQLLAESHKHGPEDHRLPTALPGGPVHLLLPQQEPTS